MTWPSRRAIARLVAATSSVREVSGFCTATAFKPAFSSCGITLAQLEPSAHAPCTRTTLDTSAMTQPPVMRYGSPKRDAGILGPPAKSSYVVEATIWDTRDGGVRAVPCPPRGALPDAARRRMTSQNEASGGAAFLIACGV